MPNFICDPVGPAVVTTTQFGSNTVPGGVSGLEAGVLSAMMEARSASVGE
jgi:hypothetical protein